jgi:hypothetical protein
MIAKAVTERGATLVVMAGPVNLPARWGASSARYPLSELFPLEGSGEWTADDLQNHLRQGFRLAVAPGQGSHLLNQLGIDEKASASLWSTIAQPDHRWYWHSDVTAARAGAEVLWYIADSVSASTARAGDAPKGGDAESAAALAHRKALLATMNVGLGKVMYLSADATWRWRQVEGLNLHERFWGQVIRWAVGSDLPAGGQFVRFGADKPRYVAGESVVVSARLLDKRLTPMRGQKFKVSARPLSGSRGEIEAEMFEAPQSPGLYRATLANLPDGQIELSLKGSAEKLLAEDPSATQKTLTVTMAAALNLEQRNINADRAALAAIAKAGGGHFVDWPYAAVIARHIPDLNYPVQSVRQIGLFTGPGEPYARTTHWIFLAAFVVLITAEWIIRKLAGLV